MELTLIKEKRRKERSAKLILFFAMASMTMMFAGITSAFVVSKSRADWLKDFQLPSAFYWSTLVMIGSSVTFHLAKLAIKKNQNSKTSTLLFLTLALGCSFVGLQFLGFSQIISKGYYFTGQAGSITTTFVYIIILVHLLHLAGGIITLLIVIYNHFKQKYNSTQTLGIELGAIYWHFLDVLWIYLFLFLFFFK